MNWLLEIPRAQPVAHAMLVLAGVIVLGLALGAIRVRGIGLDIAGVLFGGIVVGHFGAALEPDVLAFARELGLILFVFGIGMQVGPGFFHSLRAHGLVLNGLASAIVVLGACIAVGLGRLLHLSSAVIAGIFAGASTNTPALGAAQEALRGMSNVSAARANGPALGYAAAYPLGVLGIITSMLLLRAFFRVQLHEETAALEREQRPAEEAIERMSVVVENSNLDNTRVSQIPGSAELGVIVSRTKSAKSDEVRVAKPGAVISRGDTILAVGTAANLDRFRMIVGRRSDDDLTTSPGPVRSERAVVTRTAVIGKTIGEVGLRERLGVIVSRLNRAGVDLTAVPDLRLQFGDSLQLVGDPGSIEQASALVGNSVSDMSHTNFLPIFVGIGLGVLVGACPIPLPGVPAPVRLGLAGGPLVVAILLSRIGKIGPLVWYVPPSANAALRALGIVLFLACVGLKAGEHFVQNVMAGPGLVWMGVGICITVVPLLVVGTFARLVMRMNFMSVMGLIAGSTTDPPALAFANTVSGSGACSVAYTTVYPATMLLRIATAQLLVLLLPS